MQDTMVKIEKLRKSYGAFPALCGVDLELKRGEIVGLLGPNGSGKTTLIKILSGLLTSSGGVAKIDGKDVGVETKKIVSYLPERTYFNSWMRVDECLEFFKDFYEDFDIDLAKKMLGELGVNINAKLRTLSKGTKEKVQLVLVMSRRAELYLLDEPIAGVDPAAREYILNTIIANHREGSTVLISTHLITDIEKVIDSYVLIKNGQILSTGDTKTLMDEEKKTLDEHFREVFRYV